MSGDLGGQTLIPGVYTAATSLAIMSGNLTLDAQGDTNAVWIFQIGSTLVTTASVGNVMLANGAQAANVFWLVGSSATIGTGTTFQGTILAHTSITVTTGAVLNGRALGRSRRCRVARSPWTPTVSRCLPVIEEHRM